MVQCLPCKPVVTASRYKVHRCHRTFSTAAGMDASHVQLKPMFSSAELLLLGPLTESTWMTAPSYNIFSIAINQKNSPPNETFISYAGYITFYLVVYWVSPKQFNLNCFNLPLQVTMPWRYRWWKSSNWFPTSRPRPPLPSTPSSDPPWHPPPPPPPPPASSPHPSDPPPPPDLPALLSRPQ